MPLVGIFMNQVVPASGHWLCHLRQGSAQYTVVTALCPCSLGSAFLCVSLSLSQFFLHSSRFHQLLFPAERSRNNKGPLLLSRDILPPSPTANFAFHLIDQKDLWLVTEAVTVGALISREGAGGC